MESCSAQEKCINCGEAHAATSPLCAKRQKETKTRNYAKQHAVDFRTAKAAVYKTDWPKPGREGEQRSPTPQGSLIITPENQSSQRLYVAVTKAPRKKKTDARPINEEKTTPHVAPGTFPKVTESPPPASKQRNSTEKPTSVPTEAPPSKGWIPFLQTAASMICALLESVDSEWARNILPLLRMAIQLIRSW